MKLNTEIATYRREAVKALEERLNSIWIPVEEDLPDWGAHVLILDNITCSRIKIGWLDRNGIWKTGSNLPPFDVYEFEPGEVVAWKPIPDSWLEIED